MVQARSFEGLLNTKWQTVIFILRQQHVYTLPLIHVVMQFVYYLFIHFLKMNILCLKLLTWYNINLASMLADCQHGFRSQSEVLRNPVGPRYHQQPGWGYKSWAQTGRFDHTGFC